MALEDLEDLALLEDLSENTHKHAALRQYAELSSQGRLGTPKVKVTRAATPKEMELHGEFVEQLLCAITLIIFWITQNCRG